MLAALLSGMHGGPRAEIVRHPIPELDLSDRTIYTKSRGNVTTYYISGQVPPVVNKDADPASLQAYGDTKIQSIGVLNRIKTHSRRPWAHHGRRGEDAGLPGAQAARAPMASKAFMEGYTQFFGGSQPNLPARSVVGVASLANPGFLVEIEVDRGQGQNSKIKKKKKEETRCVELPRQIFWNSFVRCSLSSDACLDVDRLVSLVDRDFDPHSSSSPRHLQGTRRDQHGHRDRRHRKAADAMAARLRAAGFADADVQVFKPAPRKGNLVARLRGTGARKPILLLAHMDVVAAKSRGLVGRSVQADREGRLFLRTRHRRRQIHGGGLRRQPDSLQAGGFQARPRPHPGAGDRRGNPRPDAVGIQWLLKNHRDLIDAEFALNEGGGVGLKDGKPIRNSVQTSEKVSVSFRLEVKNKGGHSSLPIEGQRDLSPGGRLVRLSNFRFPFNLNETTRAYFERTAELEATQIAADMRAVLSASPIPRRVARLRPIPPSMRSCAPPVSRRCWKAVTPQRAAAASERQVNCRIMPGEAIEGVGNARARARRRPDLGDADGPGVSSAPSALTRRLGAIEKRRQNSGPAPWCSRS